MRGGKQGFGGKATPRGGRHDAARRCAISPAAAPDNEGSRMMPAGKCVSSRVNLTSMRVSASVPTGKKSRSADEPAGIGRPALARWGLTMAAELARYGVFSAHHRQGQRGVRTNPRPWCCGAARWNCWIAPGAATCFVAAGHKGRRREHHRRQQDHRPYQFSPTSVSPHPYALMLPQSENRAAAGGASGWLGRHGGTAGRAHRVLRIMRMMPPSPPPCCIPMAHSEGPSQTDWLIGCDGAHSTVPPRAGGCRFLGDTLQSDWVLAGHPSVGGCGCPRRKWRLTGMRTGVLAVFPDLTRPLSRPSPISAGPRGRIPRIRRWSRCRAVVDRRGSGWNSRPPIRSGCPRSGSMSARWRDYRSGPACSWRAMLLMCIARPAARG